ncbi:ornithine cyclodeaminase family protein [Pseudophaeobacter sp.]|uniref:ornithine cyclodeaminase family protein n=2 Tax=Pseudophaeobacter sp. TaxID=1971739 RepID=UPI004059C801
MPFAPMTLDAAAVDALLPRLDVVNEMRRLFVELGKGEAEQPPQSLTLLPKGQGDFITYLGALSGAGVFGAKLSPYLVQDGPAVITAWTLLMSMKTGQPLMLCDAGRLTTERTAATTALAVDYLAVSKADRLAIIGSGAIAAAHWHHVSGLRDWRSVTLYSPRLAKDAKRQAQWREICPHVQICDSAEDAAQGAEVVMLCTSSGQPVLDVAALSPGALVTSISTNVAEAHEVDPAFLNRAQVYCDYRATTPQTAGEMQLAARDHGWDSNDLRGDLAELATGASPLPDGAQPVFFRSVGLGLEDIAIANALFQCHQTTTHEGTV